MHDISDGFAFGNWLLVAFNVFLPQYSALFLLIVSMLIQWPSLSSWLMAPVLVVTYIRLARREERELSEKFGERYLAYRVRTPAFIPAWTSLRRHATALETRV